MSRESNNIEPVPVSAEPPPGFWISNARVIPRPLSPMTSSVMLPQVNAGVRHAFDEFGSLLQSFENREIGGWLYIRYIPLGGREGVPPAPEIMAERIKRCVLAVQTDKAGQVIDAWYGDWQPKLAKRIAELCDKPLAELADADLDAHLSSLTEMSLEAWRIHFILAVANLYSLYELVIACRDLLAWDESRTLQLVSGLSSKTTEPARRLGELARLAKERPAVTSLLESLDDYSTGDIISRLPQIDPEFANALADYQKEYGICVPSTELADSTLAETPMTILVLIRDQMKRNYDSAAEATRLEEQRQSVRAEALANLDEADRARFERVLDRAARAYPIREENEFFTISVPMALLRYWALEMGRRLVEKGIIQQVDDIFFLKMEEARAALGSTDDRRALVTRRRGERAWVEAHPGPNSYGQPSTPPPAIDALPPEVLFARSAIAWQIETMIAPVMSGRTQTKGVTLTGIPASHGVYQGRVRIVRDESEFGKIRAGDVMVCPATSPVWSVLFSSIGALVTNFGGILSHPAIVAREFHVPAVVATGNATELLQDDQIVKVDGTLGTVEVQW